MKIFTIGFWEDLYYNTVWGIRNLRTHFKIVWKSRPWDFNYSPLEMLKFKLKELLPQLVHEKLESRNKKIKDIKRCIEILDRQIEDDYIGVVGGLHIEKYPFEFRPINEVSKTIVDRRTPEEIKEDGLTIGKAIHLEEREWDELWTIIKDGARGWWD